MLSVKTTHKGKSMGSQYYRIIWKLKILDFGVFVNTLRDFMAQEVIFQLGHQPVASGRNLQDSLCLKHFTWMQWLEKSCLFSGCEHNLCLLQFKEGGEKLALTHCCLRALHIASPTFHPMHWKQHVPAEPEFHQGLLRWLAQVCLVDVSQNIFCSRALLSCAHPQPWQGLHSAMAPVHGQAHER